MNEANEALKNWQSLLPALEPLISQQTKNAVRRKKMDVAIAPYNTVIGVKDPGDTTVIKIPYQPSCAAVVEGQSVWVEWLYDNFSTAIAVAPGNGVEPVIGNARGTIANMNDAKELVCAWGNTTANKPSDNYGVALTFGFNIFGNTSTQSVWVFQVAFGTSGTNQIRRKINNAAWSAWTAL